MTITDLGSGCQLHSRDEWAQGRHVVGVPDSRTLADLTEFFVHHSGGNRLGDNDPAQWIRNIYDDHVHNRLYCDIAYELCLDESGDLWECRPNNLWSAATYGHNFHGMACCVLRQNDPESDGVPMPVQIGLRKAFQLSQLGIDLAGGNGSVLAARCHRDVYPTDCPGNDETVFTHLGGLSKPFPKGQ